MFLSSPELPNASATSNVAEDIHMAMAIEGEIIIFQKVSQGTIKS